MRIVYRRSEKENPTQTLHISKGTTQGVGAGRRLYYRMVTYVTIMLPFGNIIWGFVTLSVTH